MPGPTPPWGHEDPRESTVDLPRVEHPGPSAALSAPGGSIPPARPAAPEPGLATHATSQPADPRAELAAAAAAAERVGPEREAWPAARRPPAGSLADLRSRLARLPDGHPSSPYDDGGTARPLPVRLKQLELGLPAPEREHASPELVPGFPPSRARPLPELAGSPGRPADLTPAADLGPPANLAPPARERPPADFPAAVAPAASGNGHAQPARRARPDWQDPYAAPTGNGHFGDGRPGGQADIALAPWTPGKGSAATISGGSGPPDRQARPDLPAPRDPAVRADAAAHHASVAGPVTSQPNDEIRDLTAHVMAACKTAEGQNLLGEYGSSGLTPAIRRIAAQLPYGGLAPGSEANSLKSAPRFAAKLARLVARNPGRPPEDLAWAIYDAVRYAFTFEAADYTEGTWLVHRKLKTQGFELEARRNRWENPEYKGIWTRWRDPAHGLAFEVQFHTAASWAVVQRTHDAYVRITDPATPAGERARLRARQVSAAVEAKPPPRCQEIDDFRADVR